MSLSIIEWCARHKVSRAHFYELDARGEAPKSFYTGRARRISEESDAAWVAARERSATRDRVVAQKRAAQRKPHDYVAARALALKRKNKIRKGRKAS